MKESEYFYYRNRQGIMEKYHVSQWREIMDGQTRQSRSTAREDSGNTTSIPGGKIPSETHDPKPIRGLEKKDTSATASGTSII